MKLSRFHHVAIICSDYFRSKNFYTNILGFTVIAENFRKERESYKLDLAGPGGMQIELFSFPDSPPRITRPEACGLRHLAFEVEDVDASIAFLRSQGVQTEQPRIDEYTGRKFVFFSDPDNLPLELYQRL